MANSIRIKKRAAGGAAGAPAALRSSELAFNEQDSTLYYGFGDDGGANATSVISIGGSGAFSTLTTNQTISGDKTFTGSVDLTGATATATTQAQGTNNTSLATTAFVVAEIGANDPLTTNGDLLYYNSGNVRLGIGTAGQVLTVSGGLPVWADATGGASALNDLTDVTITAAATGEFLRYNGSAWVDTVLVAGDIPNLDTAKITTGTFADARIAQSNVTQHQAALSITESQISDLQAYLTSVALNDVTDVTITAAATGEFLRYNGSAWVDTLLVAGDIPDLDAAKITSGTFVDARIAESNVTQHQAALSITESQISDLDSYVSKTAVGTESMAGSLTIAGDLTVNGTTTTLNTQDVLVEDKNIVLGNVGTPTDITADGGGITLLGASNKTFNWVDATDAWTSSEHLNLAATKEYRLNGVTVLGYNGATEILDNVEIDGGTF